MSKTKAKLRSRGSARYHPRMTVFRAAVRPWIIMGAWYARPRASRQRRVDAILNRFVVPWDQLVKRAEGRGRGRGRAPGVLFTHIPKTGGTTLEAIIARNEPPNGLIHINSNTLHRNPAALFKHGSFPRVVMGHHALHHVLYRFLDREVAHVTMLRDPVSRLISYFHYLKTSPNHELHAAVKGMTLTRFARSNVSTELENGQTMRLAGFQRRAPGRALATPETALARAKELLEQRCSIVGVTERYIEFLLACRRLLGWDDVFHRRRNVSARAPERDSVADDETLAVIRDRNAADVELHVFARDLFDSRAGALGVDGAAVEAFHEANQRYLNLMGAVG
jgi:hypothetical protein